MQNLQARAVAAGFQPILNSGDVDHWHAGLSQALGDCRVDLRPGKRLSFAARIGACAIGALSLVELRSEGARLDLRRQQRSDAAVLWLPEQGSMEERLAGSEEAWQVSPGQALWVAPGTELRGLSEEHCAGVSIVLPAALLDQLSQRGGATSLLNPFQTRRLPSLGPLLRAAREMIAAARQQPGWLQPSAALFWQALVKHCEQAWGVPPLEPDGQQAASLSNQFLELCHKQLGESPRARFHLGELALALHVTPRTLQGHLRRELDASPREVWECLQQERGGPTCW
ncbi:MAG: hypothetical protein ACKOPT_02095 [Cyanobium sp.]